MIRWAKQVISLPLSVTLLQRVSASADNGSGLRDLWVTSPNRIGNRGRTPRRDTSASIPPRQDAGQTAPAVTDCQVEAAQRLWAQLRS
jgi:hypothetical protein